MTVPLVNRADVTLYAERRGNDPPLLFINGTGSGLRARPNGFRGAPAKVAPR
ncbi:MAG TPA: hypothetical protein VHA79_10370 [Mycobacteriales bacterium]|nr:hypothetical protein [Mycobacteriales bacterium]